MGGGKAHLLISLLLSTMFFAFTLLGRLFGPVGLYERHDTYVNSYLMINCPIEFYACFQLPSRILILLLLQKQLLSICPCLLPLVLQEY